jgi:hypothetical protein
MPAGPCRATNTAMNRRKFDCGHARRTSVHALACAALLLSSGCSVANGALSTARGTSSLFGNGETLAIDGLQGRWAGKVTPTAANCGEPTDGSMRIGDTGFGFDPFGSTTVITGTVSDDGKLTGTMTRVAGGGDNGGSIETALPGPGGKPTTPAAAAAHGPRTLSISLDAKAAKGADGHIAIEGVLTSGRCTWHVALKRA